MTRPTTTETIEIENRDVEITVRAPTPPGLMLLQRQLPDQVLDAESINDIDGVTFRELHQACVAMINATTIIPREVAEELPIDVARRLTIAAGDVIEEDQEQQVQQAREFEAHMDGVTDGNHVEGIMEFAESTTDTDEVAAEVDTLFEVTEIPFITEDTATALIDEGYETFEDIQEVDQEDLAGVEPVGHALAARLKHHVTPDQ